MVAGLHRLDGNLSLTAIDMRMPGQSLAPTSTSSVLSRRRDSGLKSCTGSAASLVISKVGCLAIAAVGVGVALALPLLVSWWIVMRPPVNASPPSCPFGTNLYVRSLIAGKVQSTVYHCFRDEDEQEDTVFGPRGPSPSP